MSKLDWEEIPNSVDDEISYVRRKLNLSEDIYSDEQVIQLIKEVEKLSRLYVATFKGRKFNSKSGEKGYN